MLDLFHHFDSAHAAGSKTYYVFIDFRIIICDEVFINRKLYHAVWR